MTREKIEETVKKIISDHLNRPIEEVKPESSIIEDLGADSLDAVELTMSFEEEFGMQIPDADSENFITVKQVIDYLEARNV